MDSTGIASLFRTEMADTAIPPLWSDEEFYSYLDDAQKMFARLTGGIADSTTPLVTQIPLSIGDATFPLSSLILKVRAAYRVSDGKEIALVNYENMSNLGMRFDSRKGPVQAIIIGMDTDTAKPWPIPSIADTVQLVVDRLPLDDITLVDAPQDMEIDPQHHRHLMLWMKALAYEKQDAETFNKSKSIEFTDKFEKYCFKAFKERERRIHKPRSVRYGGLPLGPRAQSDYGDYWKGNN